MSLRCLFGHDWTIVSSPVDTDRESVTERERRRRCTRCGKEHVEKRTTQVSIAAAEDALTPSIALDGGSDNPEPPYDDEQLEEDEQKLVEGDDALIIEDDEEESESTEAADDRPSQSSSGADESTPVTEATDTQSESATESNSDVEEVEETFDPDRFNGDVNESDNSDAAILDAGPENNTEPSNTSSSSSSSSQSGPVLSCPFCSYESNADDATIRSGDVCPDCHQGFVEEQ